MDLAKFENALKIGENEVGGQKGGQKGGHWEVLD